MPRTELPHSVLVGAHRRIEAGEPWIRVARDLGIAKDTLKRVLIRAGLYDCDEEKFAADIRPKERRPSKSSKSADVWSRSCLKCGENKPRPRGLFLCDQCRSRQSSSMMEDW